MFVSKKRYVLLGVAGALVLLLGGVGIAYAQDPEPATDGVPFFGGGYFAGRGAFRGRPFEGSPLGEGRFGGGPAHGLVDVTAEVTDLTHDEVVAALEDGQTLAEIARGEGMEPETVVSAAAEEARSRMEAAVDNGRLSQEQMEQSLERLTEGLSERLDQPFEPGGPMGGLFGQFRGGFWTMYDAVADALELEPDELFAELHDGKTVGDVAEEQGVELDDVRNAVEDARVEARTAAIEQAVEDGRMTQEQADWMIEGLEEGFMPGGQGPGLGRNFGPGSGGCGRGKGW